MAADHLGGGYIGVLAASTWVGGYIGGGVLRRPPGWVGILGVLWRAPGWGILGVFWRPPVGGYGGPRYHSRLSDVGKTLARRLGECVSPGPGQGGWGPWGQEPPSNCVNAAALGAGATAVGELASRRTAAATFYQPRAAAAGGWVPRRLHAQCCAAYIGAGMTKGGAAAALQDSLEMGSARRA